MATDRWGDEAFPPWGIYFPAVTVGFTWLMFIGACIGIGRLGFRTYGLAALSLYVLYYTAALLAVGFNPRFMAQALPFYAIFAGSQVCLVRGRSRGHPTSEGANAKPAGDT